MKILFINNDGGGFSEYREIESGTNAGQLFRQEYGRDSDTSSYKIRVNSLPVDMEHVLLDGDRVSITQRKQVGA